MNYENDKNYKTDEIKNNNIEIINKNIETEIIVNNKNIETEILLNNKNIETEIILNNNIDILFDKTNEFLDKINFIKAQLPNDKLKKSISNNLLNIIEKIDKSIDVIDETIICNGFIEK
jgi:hypothetical protein